MHDCTAGGEFQFPGLVVQGSEGDAARCVGQPLTEFADGGAGVQVANSKSTVPVGRDGPDGRGIRFRLAFAPIYSLGWVGRIDVSQGIGAIISLCAGGAEHIVFSGFRQVERQSPIGCHQSIVGVCKIIIREGRGAIQNTIYGKAGCKVGTIIFIGFSAAIISHQVIIHILTFNNFIHLDRMGIVVVELIECLALVPNGLLGELEAGAAVIGIGVETDILANTINVAHVEVRGRTVQRNGSDVIPIATSIRLDNPLLAAQRGFISGGFYACHLAGTLRQVGRAVDDTCRKDIVVGLGVYEYLRSGRSLGEIERLQVVAVLKSTAGDLQLVVFAIHSAVFQHGCAIAFDGNGVIDLFFVC